LTLNPTLPFVGWLLLAHAALPGRPYGSLGARGRVDPGGDWRMPAPIFTGAWILMALAYTYSGYTKLLSPSWMDGTALARILESPPARPTAVGAWLLELPELALQLATWGFLALELLFAPLALFRAVRPWLWLAMLSLQPALILLGGSADSSVGMMMVHFFTFNPAWIRARPAAAAEEFFYDGHCGLCQRSVRFFLAEDRSEKAFIFAPLQSEAFAAAIPPSERAGLPDSVVVRTAGGRLLVRSAAILHAMARLGGAWRLAAALARLVPRPLRDAAYDLVARLRHRLFARPPSMCPRMPERLRGRFRV
jgi:predicted DCC family thiol-disulfide oxidoreductase YuxK